MHIGSDNSEGLSDDEMDNSTTELQVTEDCLEDEVDDGEVWEGVNASEIAPSTSEDDGDDGGAIQINSGQGYIMHVVSLVVLAISALSLISLYYFCI